MATAVIWSNVLISLSEMGDGQLGRHRRVSASRTATCSINSVIVTTEAAEAYAKEETKDISLVHVFASVSELSIIIAEGKLVEIEC